MLKSLPNTVYSLQYSLTNYETSLTPCKSRLRRTIHFLNEELSLLLGPKGNMVHAISSDPRWEAQFFGITMATCPLTATLGLPEEHSSRSVHSSDTAMRYRKRCKQSMFICQSSVVIGLLMCSSLIANYMPFGYFSNHLKYLTGLHNARQSCKTGHNNKCTI